MKREKWKNLAMTLLLLVIMCFPNVSFASVTTGSQGYVEVNELIYDTDPGSGTGDMELIIRGKILKPCEVIRGQVYYGDDIQTGLQGEAVDERVFQTGDSFELRFIGFAQTICDYAIENGDGLFTVYITAGDAPPKKAEDPYRIRFKVTQENQLDSQYDLGKVAAGTQPSSDKNQNKNNGTNLFKDISGHWAEKQVMEMTGKGMVSGYDDGTFRPNQSISRAEFAQMIQNMFHYEQTKVLTNFSDIAETDWYYKPVGALYENGIIAGLEPSKFGPNERITREQMVSILSRAVKQQGLKIETKRNYNSFEDEKLISVYAKDAVREFYEAEIIEGTKGGGESSYFFNPRNTATRAEAVVMIKNVLELEKTE